MNIFFKKLIGIVCLMSVGNDFAAEAPQDPLAVGTNAGAWIRPVLFFGTAAVVHVLRAREVRWQQANPYGLLAPMLKRLAEGDRIDREVMPSLETHLVCYKNKARASLETHVRVLYYAQELSRNEEPIHPSMLTIGQVLAKLSDDERNTYHQDLNEIRKGLGIPSWYTPSDKQMEGMNIGNGKHS